MSPFGTTQTLLLVLVACGGSTFQNLSVNEVTQFISELGKSHGNEAKWDKIGNALAKEEVHGRALAEATLEDLGELGIKKIWARKLLSYIEEAAVVNTRRVLQEGRQTESARGQCLHSEVAAVLAQYKQTNAQIEEVYDLVANKGITGRIANLEKFARASATCPKNAARDADNNCTCSTEGDDVTYDEATFQWEGDCPSAPTRTVETKFGNAYKVVSFSGTMNGGYIVEYMFDGHCESNTKDMAYWGQLTAYVILDIDATWNQIKITNNGANNVHRPTRWDVQTSDSPIPGSFTSIHVINHSNLPNISPDYDMPLTVGKRYVRLDMSGNSNPIADICDIEFINTSL